MAYDYNCAGAIAAIEHGIDYAFSQGDKAIAHKQDAEVHWNLNQDHLAIEDINKALSDLAFGLQRCNYKYAPFYYTPALVYYLTECIAEPEEYELTAKKICEAWIADDFKDRALTIAIIDRMRQLIWDEPFYIQWAARPEQ